MKRLVAHSWMAKYLRFFSASLKHFPEKHVPLIFAIPPTDPIYLAYLCPLCLENYLVIDRQAYRESSIFSEDHFPPESVGGKATVLVCKKCNNNAGATYENSLTQKLERVSFDKGVVDSQLKARSVITNVPGWRHGAVTIGSNKELLFQLLGKGSDKLKPLTEDEARTNNNGKGWTVNITVHDLAQEKITRALLKSAYLFCFFNWGYEFVFSAQGDLMRQAISGRSEYPIPIGWLWFDFQTPLSPGAHVPTGLCFVSHPVELQCLVINLPMQLKRNNYSCVVPVIVPSPTPNWLDDLKRIQVAIEGNPTQLLTFLSVNNALLHGIENPYTRTWADLTTQFSR